MTPWRLVWMLAASGWVSGCTWGSDGQSSGEGQENPTTDVAPAGPVTAVERDPAAGPLPNIVVVDIDSMRADRIGSGVAPHVDALAARGIQFERAGAPAGWTLPSALALLSGRYPTGELLESPPMGPYQQRLLPWILHAYGYHRAFAWGWTLLDLHPSRSAWFGPDAEDLEDIDGLTGRIAELPEPFFVFVHDIDLHIPPREGVPDLRTIWRERGDLEEVIREYDRTLIDYDVRLGKMLAALEASGRADRTILVLTSDHGEELGERGEVDHGMSMYEEVMHVPLVIFDPRRAAPGVVSKSVQGIDVAPTLLDLAAIPIHAEMEGISLLPALSGRADELPERLLFSMTNRVSASVLSGSTKFVLQPAKCPRNEQLRTSLLRHEPCKQFFDLATDPGETTNLLGERSERASELESALLEWIEERGDVDDLGELRALRETLRTRGYWGADQ